MTIGAAAPAFSLMGTDQREWTLEDFANSKVLVVIFTCNHCPYAKAAEDRLIGLQRHYAEDDVRVVAINPNDSDRYPEDSFEKMVGRAGAKGFNFPYLFDETQQVARDYGAACTPDPFVFSPERTLTYNGRIDDHWQDESKATHHDLARAIERTLAGEPIDFDVVPAIGCSIKWRT